MGHLSPVGLQFSRKTRKSRLAAIKLNPLNGVSKEYALTSFQEQHCGAWEINPEFQCPAMRGPKRERICAGMGCDGKARVFVARAGGMLKVMQLASCMHDERGFFQPYMVQNIEV